MEHLFRFVPIVKKLLVIHKIVVYKRLGKKIKVLLYIFGCSDLEHLFLFLTIFLVMY